MYSPIHLHTFFSPLDGIIKLDELKEACIKYNFPAIAITDHGNMFGALKFYNTFKDTNIKPILGEEFYCSENLESKELYHLVILAKNEEGYKNLVKLSSIAYEEKYFYKKARITPQLLREYHNGLICTTACLQSYIRERESGDILISRLDELLGIFGNQDLYLEVQRNELSEQEQYNQKLFQLSEKYNLKVIATTDAHWLNRGEDKAHSLFLCVKTKDTINSEKRFKFNTKETFLKSPQEMEELWKDHLEVLANTIEVANKCNVQLKYSGAKFPKHLDSNKKEIDSKAWIEEKTNSRLKELNLGEDYKKRLDYELSVINKMGFASYFGVLNEVMEWCDRVGITRGPARGCLIGETKVYTNKGVKELKNIKIGDYVLTHTGKWQKVLNTMSYEINESLLSIKTSFGYTGDILTKDHKVYGIKREYTDTYKKSKKTRKS